MNCPSCGAEVRFKSRSTVFCVCAFCRSMLVRHDLSLENLGKMADLQEDPSPLQLGTRGKFEGRPFEILGRLMIQWSDGGWSEWFMHFDDGREGWLAEAQGFYMVSFKSEGAVIPPKNGLYPETRIQIGNHLYNVDDIKNAVCAGSEGELPFPAPRGRRNLSVDLSSDGQGFACLDYADEGNALYVGRYVEFDALELTNLRAIDGW